MHRGTSVWCSLALLALATALTGCAVSVHNRPSNLPLTPGLNAPAGPARDIAGENLVALSFSGGGLRAAAFSFGAIKALHAAGTPEQDVLSDVTMISSVSGGSLTAAYYGLHGPAALTPENFIRRLSGGLNDRANLVNWLDQQVFEGATFADLYARRKPDIWNAARGNTTLQSYLRQRARARTKTP